MTFRQFLLLFFLALFTIACQSNINQIEVEILADTQSFPVDSLKYALTGLQGINYVAMSPDTSHITLKYDRYKTHSDVILQCISEYGYHPRLISKKSISVKKEAVH
ncbi:MAG: hypothetical protein DRP86_04620 [Candidatus Neomarinimicrobiota bacterium]|nr:hypothetical protein [Candidatus Neomarinimicrobiota bacterium]RKY49831.1 MAG: hypothetical protein DRP86_04620 [Candidatus Neomarinimicrobiota bacterium]